MKKKHKPFIVIASLLVIAWSIHRMVAPEPTPYSIDYQTYYPTWGSLLARTAVDLADGGTIVLLVPEEGMYPAAPMPLIIKGIEAEIRRHAGYNLRKEVLGGLTLIGGVDLPGINRSMKSELDRVTADAAAVISLAGPPSFEVSNRPPMVVMATHDDNLDALLAARRMEAAVVPILFQPARTDPALGQEQFFRTVVLSTNDQEITR